MPTITDQERVNHTMLLFLTLRSLSNVRYLFGYYLWNQVKYSITKECGCPKGYEQSIDVVVIGFEAFVIDKGQHKETKEGTCADQ